MRFTKPFSSLFIIMAFCFLGVWPLLGDEIHLKDQRVLRGKIVYEGEEFIKLKMKWGMIKIERERILKIIKKESPKEEFEKRFAKIAWNDWEGYYQLGLFAKKHGMKEAMKRCFQKVLEINPNHRPSREALGYVWENGQWVKKEGRENQSKAKALVVPRKAEEMVQKGMEFFTKAKKDSSQQRELLDKAIFYLKGARNLAPTYYLPYFKLGVLYQWTREFKKAKTNLEKALRFKPQDGEILIELGDTYSWMAKYDQALEIYKKALKINPKLIQGYLSMALAYCKLRKFQEAKKALEKGLKVKKDFSLYRLFLLVSKELQPLPWKKKYTITSKHYVVYTNSSEEYGKTISEHAELIYKVYTRIFPKKRLPTGKFPIFVFATRKGYFENGAPKGTAGYFHPILQKLVFFKQNNLDNTLTVLYHEGFHQYVHYYAPYIPSWFNEGNGDFFGGCRKEGNQLRIKPNKWRLGLIKRAIQKESYVPLDKLMQMSKAQLYSGNRGLHYAQAWALVYFFWMYQNGTYRKYLKKYFSLIRKGYGRIEAYQKVFSKIDMKYLENEWKRYILSLK